MLFFYLAIFASLFFGLRVKRAGFYDDFLGRKQTDAVKGLFILMVLLSHSILEVQATGTYPLATVDIIGYRIRTGFGQLVIVMFFFYSGYGVMEAIKGKGKEYIDSFPRHRVLTTLLNFDVAVLFFIGLNLLMGVRMDLNQIAWSFVAWKNVGNSNWYIFVILYCYLASWVSAKVFPRNSLRLVLMTFLLVLAGEALLSFVKHGETRWYDTLLCYPVGMCFSLFKERFSAFVRRYYLPSLVLVLAVFLFFHFQRWIPALRGLTYNAKSIAFCLLVVLVTMKVKVGNRLLYWAGASVFPIYIYQRLPMRALSHWAGEAWVAANPYVFILLCGVITCIIACLYKRWQIKL